MKLYKFRSLANEDDFNRAKHILGTGQFWCSQFTELNDPMEGVFTVFNSKNVNKLIKGICNEKFKYKFCSFSHEEAFDNPLLWGYYANGFKGIAIEIEVEDGRAEEWKVKYIPDIKELGNLENDEEIIKGILRSKLSSWQHEVEYRFLEFNNRCGDSGIFYKIGEIKGVYFGDPYSNVTNREQILEHSPSLQKYERWKNQLWGFAEIQGKQCFSVAISDRKVQKI